MSTEGALSPLTTRPTWAAILAAPDTRTKQALARQAVTAVEVPGFDLPVPPFFFDLDWDDDEAGAVDSILADIVLAEDITTVADKRESRKLVDIVGQPVTVHGIRAAKGDIEDGRWGAYLRVTASVDGGEPELFFVSSGQVTVTLWRLEMEGKLPASGQIVEVAAAKKGRSAPLGFRVEEAF